MKRLKKNGCDFFWTEDITLSLNSKKDTGKLLGKMMGDGYVTLTCPQIGIRILYVKVFGGPNQPTVYPFVIIWCQSTKVFINYFEDYFFINLR